MNTTTIQAEYDPEVIQNILDVWGKVYMVKDTQGNTVAIRPDLVMEKSLAKKKEFGFIGDQEMKYMGRVLGQLLGDKKHAFALLVTGFDVKGQANYISNVEREDMIKMLRETADRLESRLGKVSDFPTPSNQ